MMERNIKILLVAQIASILGTATATYTWPSETDFMETLLYEQIGRDAFSPAAVVAPCGIVDLGKGRSVAAEWIRTAYHDMATADVVAGIGGIDASIGFELDRAENPGRPQFSETMLNMQQHLTARSSLADLVAMGAVLSAGSCSAGKVVIPFRGGRIDATKAGPSGVPEPQQDINSHLSAFKRQGFNKTEMIGLVACGHTLGGVHGVDFPTIVDVPATSDNKTKDDHTQTFDNSTNSFDNSVAVDFTTKGKQNPLAFGHNETTRSDARIFGSDGMAEIKRLASSNDEFLKTCTRLMERMVNTVPKAVKLTEPIQAIAVKPSKLFATINGNGTMTFSGQIRLVDQFAPNPDRSVKITFRNRFGEDCAKTKSCSTAQATADEQSWTTSSTGQGPAFPLFKKYLFSADIPLAKGISSFTVAVTDKVDGKPKTKTYTNNGKGFPFDDTIATQPNFSCADRFSSGLFNVTVAVRDDAHLPSVSGVVQVPSSVGDAEDLVPFLKTIPLKLTKIGNVSKYTLYNAQHTYKVGTYRRMYNVEASNGSRTVKSVFNDADELPGC